MFLDYVSLINKNPDLKETKLAKSKMKPEEEIAWQRSRRRLRRPRFDYQD